jgi:hypothetical protein
VNFDYTSFMENREAGVVLSGAASEPLRTFASQVFDYDWNIAVPFKPNQV